jgi:RNA polymerase sigma-70 factor (ECF subfamily)
LKSAGAGRSIPLGDEKRLVEQAKSGDGEAFALLYEAYFDRVYRFIFFRVTDVQIAEDLTSQVFLKAWENLNRYHPRGPFLAWLYAIARNTVIDTYRTKKQTVSLDEAAPMAAQDDKLDDRMQLQFEVQSMQAAMQHLTKEQQEVIMLKFIAEFDTAQIARHMGKSEGAIRALQMRALQALARVMKNQSNGE